jgi:hypothetical protein
MLTIKNYNKLEGRLLEFTGGWVVATCNEREYAYTIEVKNSQYTLTPNVQMIFLLSRKKESLGNGEWRYFFYYEGKKIEFCVDAEYISNMDVMLETLCKIVNKYQ